MWALAPAELAAIYNGVERARRLETERAMRAAYQTVLFYALAKAGELKGWSTYRAEMFGHLDAPAEKPAPVDSMAIKERRRQQMEHFRKQQQARNKPLRRPRG